MKREIISFSQRIKDELSQVPCREACCRQVELAAAFWVAAKIGRAQAEISTGHAGFAERLARLAKDQHQLSLQIRHGSGYHILSLEKQQYADFIQPDINAVFHAEGRDDLESWPVCCRRALLRALYLACGSVSEPAAAYHMELAVRRSSQAAATCKHLLDQLGFRSTLVQRQHYHVICLREGQYLSDYLLLADAQQSLLAFESLRVEKEMRNSVNRIVNCDSANLQRVADTAARQSALLFRLQEAALDGQLPPDLQAAAEMRRMNPELSLKELGQLMNPPLGKSGMNHRLKRFETLAAELLSHKEH